MRFVVSSRRRRQVARAAEVAAGNCPAPPSALLPGRRPLPGPRQLTSQAPLLVQTRALALLVCQRAFRRAAGTFASRRQGPAPPPLPQFSAYVSWLLQDALVVVRRCAPQCVTAFQSLVIACEPRCASCIMRVAASLCQIPSVGCLRGNEPVIKKTDPRRQKKNMFHIRQSIFLRS